jgi:tRNA/tmRNA/rRNA uracil-C5-methylase (TrmA/RlmC/RlmD family)
LLELSSRDKINETFEKLSLDEKEFIKEYLNSNKKNLAEKYSLTLTPSRIEVVAAYYSKHIMDIERVIQKIKSYYDEIKKIELLFYKNHDINIVMEEDAIDLIIEQFEKYAITVEDFYEKLSQDFEHGLKLVQEKSGRNRFFITKKALLDPGAFISKLIRDELSMLSD